MIVAKKCDEIQTLAKTKTPGSLAHFRGFLCRYVRGLKPFRLLLPVVSVQPFANIVANYIRRNRNKKCDD